MDKQIIAAASSESEKYFFEPAFDGIPDVIKDEIHILCVTLADKLGCSFVMGFHDDGDVFFNIIKPEDALDFDDIGTELEIKEVQRDKKDLLEALSLWYKVFKTTEGEKIKAEILKKDLY